MRDRGPRGWKVASTEEKRVKARMAVITWPLRGRRLGRAGRSPLRHAGRTRGRSRTKRACERPGRAGAHLGAEGRRADHPRRVREDEGGARSRRKVANSADMAFYATLVRVHRKGEGAPFTGLKPAGEIEPPIRAADHALESGDVADVEAPLVASVHAGLAQRHDAVTSRRGFDPANVDAGRAYVGAYVDYVHYVERLYDAAGSAPTRQRTKEPRTHRSTGPHTLTEGRRNSGTAQPGSARALRERRAR